MRKIVLYISLFLTMVFILSCGRKQESTLPPDQDNFIQAYVAISKLLDTWSPSHPAYIDSTRAILKSFNLTKESFDSKIAFLNEKTERWELFYAKVLERYNDVEMDTTRTSVPRPTR